MSWRHLGGYSNSSAFEHSNDLRKIASEKNSSFELFYLALVKVDRYSLEDPSLRRPI